MKSTLIALASIFALAAFATSEGQERDNPAARDKAARSLQSYMIIEPPKDLQGDNKMKVEFVGADKIQEVCKVKGQPADGLYAL